MRVLQLLPHRFPMLLVDRMYDMNGDESCVGVKNVTINEPFFIGHFPQYPVMPGVLIIEGLAQTAGALCVSSLKEDYHAELVYFMGIDRAKFRRPVVPGDQIHYHVRKVRNRGRVWKFFGEAKVDGQVAAEAEVSAMLADTAEARAFASKHG
jgi:3-hydroxyacyl-[acyl-carrier-protein] dehydratase